MSESFGCIRDTSVKIVWRKKHFKKFSTTLLNSVKQGKTRQRLHIEIRHVKKKVVNKFVADREFDIKI